MPFRNPSHSMPCPATLLHSSVLTVTYTQRPVTAADFIVFAAVAEGIASVLAAVCCMAVEDLPTVAPAKLPRHHSFVDLDPSKSHHASL
ncbi:MAG: hypothetical protein Q9194_007381 [Teloschistes cf. exilis]